MTVRKIGRHAPVVEGKGGRGAGAGAGGAGAGAGGAGAGAGAGGAGAGGVGVVAEEDKSARRMWPASSGCKRHAYDPLRYERCNTV